MTTEAYIFDAIRTPRGRGKANGSLHDVRPLADELSLMLREIRLGTTRSDGLRNLAERCGVPEVSSFSSVLIQADRLGASIGTVLRAQADLMRAERFQRAEKAGARASSIILVPLVLFILPAALLVTVGPVLLRFIYGMG